MRAMMRCLAAAVLVPLAACGEAPGGPPQVGGQMPAYEARTLEGEPAALASLRGNPVLLNVWATWCHPCREEIPALEELHREYGPRGLEVLGVSIDQGQQQAKIREFLGEFGATYPSWHDRDNEISTSFALMGVPSTFLVGADGELLWKHVGPVKADDAELRRLIEGALTGE